MATTSMRPESMPVEIRRRTDWGDLLTWVLAFGLIAFLGLEGGGYDPLVHDQVGIAVWWILLVGVLCKALPRAPLSRTAGAAALLLGAFALWSLLSLTWTESSERTLIDVARVATYLGIFLLALGAGDPRERRRLLGAVASAIVLVAVVGLLSRLHPSWFSDSNQTGRLLESENRLSYPLNYWNALGALTALAIPLLLHLATTARNVLTRALAAAAIPALVLTVYFTLSRGSIGAGAIAVVLFLLLTSDRLPRVATALSAGAGGALLVVLAHHRSDLTDGLTTSVAHHQGNQMLGITVAVCFLVGAVQAAVTLAGRGVERPAWSRPSRRATSIGFGVAVAALIVVALAAGAPHRISNGWDEFKNGGGPGEGSGRLTSVSGEERYQFWSAAVDENATKPLTGTGSGTFQFWWARNGEGGETVHDTHSLYFQTLGELGIVGLLLIGSFLILVFVAGGVVVARGDPELQAWAAASVAAIAVFALTAAVDWMWQVPVVPTAMLLLAAGLLNVRGDDWKPRLPLLARVGIAVFCLAAIVLIAIPLATTSLVRQSQTQAREGDLDAALSSARSAQNVEPGAASPRLQEALVLELERNYRAAEAAARAATEHESTNWRNWIVLSRIAAEGGRADQAVAAYRKARSLDPRGKIFGG